jgi:XXXCH domain-containing protein
LIQFKKLKYNLDLLFQKIQKSADEGEYPNLEDAKKFVRLCGQMQTAAPEEWAYEADDFSHLANQLLQSIKNQEIKDVVPLVDSLFDSMNYCHRSFRDT